MGKRVRESDTSTDVSSYDSAEQTATSPAKMVEFDTLHDSCFPYTRMQCSLPPHPLLSFPSAEEFDVHYAKEHTNRCSACGRNLPSTHYLILHIDENHNPLREALAAKGERTYACFVEDCDRKCSTPQKRRLHLIDKHAFPKVYNFRVIDYGIDKSSSLLQGGQRRRLSVSTNLTTQRLVTVSSQSEISEQLVDTSQQSTYLVPHREIDRIEEKTAADRVNIDDLTAGLASLKFVPPSVQARQRDTRRPQ